MCPVSEVNAPDLIRGTSGPKGTRRTRCRPDCREKLCIRTPAAPALVTTEGTRSNCDSLRGIHMDIDHGLSRLPVLGAGLKGRCGSCTTAQRAADPRSRRPSEHVDEGFFLISGPDLDGWVVVPRPQISGLEELPIPHRASVLAALRRAARSVRIRYPWAMPTIVVRTDLPASEGHVCFQVLPWVPGYAVDSRTRSGCPAASARGPMPAKSWLSRYPDGRRRRGPANNK